MIPGALSAREAIGLRPPPRWLFFAVCAAAFFVLAYGSATTWAQVQRGLAEGFDAQLDAMARGSEGGNPLRQVAGVTMGVVGAWALAARRGTAALRPPGALGVLVLAFLALYALGVAWADEPLLTARRALSFGMMALAIAGAVRSRQADDLPAYALVASTAYLAVAAVAELASGAFEPFAPDYRFSGVYHPNTVAAMCDLLVFAAVSAPRAVRPGLRRAAVLAGVTVLALTRSRAGLLGLVVPLGLRWVIAPRPPGAKLLAPLALAWLAVAAAFVGGDRLARATRDAVVVSRSDSDVETLSGRTALWSELLRDAAERPVLGYGVGGFWSARRVEQLYASQGWPVAEAHSTYLDQVLDAGAVGLAVFVAVMLAAAWRAARLLRATGAPAYGFMLLVVSYFLVVGAFETMQSPSYVSFVVFWAVAFLAFRDPGTERRAPCAST